MSDYPYGQQFGLVYSKTWSQAQRDVYDSHVDATLRGQRMTADVHREGMRLAMNVPTGRAKTAFDNMRQAARLGEVSGELKL